MKRSSREVWLDFKNNNPTKVSIPKTIFLGFIKSRVEGLKPEEHMCRTYKKCGLCPLILPKLWKGFPMF